MASVALEAVPTRILPALPAPRGSAKAKRPTGTWSAAAQRVFGERYLLKNAEGQPIETPDDLLWRVATAVASAEAPYVNASHWLNDRSGVLRQDDPVTYYAQRFYQLMVTRRFLPNSPTLMNAGKGNGLQLSACYVLPVPDSVEGIFDAIKYAALIHQSGGGTGFSFSRLRQAGARVRTTVGVASGPVSFMRVFDAATEGIRQGGQRRGANMGVLRVDHPDIFDFINCKRDGTVTNFNISVGITEAYMTALKAQDEFALRDPRDGTVVRTVKAQAIMDAICDAAWTTGDPGLVFLDRLNASDANPVPALEQIEATNPCGEQALGPYDACNLGSLNLGAYADPEQVDGVNWEQLTNDTWLATRFLDDVIDINPYPLPQVRAQVTANRRIGLGVMGWADLLLTLGLRYDSDQALALGQKIMQTITDAALHESRQLATERGAFPNFAQSRHRDAAPLRNATVTTVAPTGSISILADCSSGIEPLFALAYQHRVKQPEGDYRVLDFVHPQFTAMLGASGMSPSAKTALLDHVLTQGRLQDYDAPLPGAARAFVTAHEIEADWHVAMQAAFQKGVSNSISKTVNLPHTATVADVARCYRLAYQLGCMGVTIFRDGSKSEQVLNLGVRATAEAAETPVTVTAAPLDAGTTGDTVDATDAAATLAQALAVLDADEAVPGAATFVAGIKSRPEVLRGYTRQIRAPEGKVNLTINSDATGPFEVFVNVGKAGSDIEALAEALGRLISLALRLEGPVTTPLRLGEIAHQLSAIGGSGAIGFGRHRVASLPDAIAQALYKHLDTLQATTVEADALPAVPSVPLILAPSVPSVPSVPDAPRPLTGPSGNLCPACGNTTLHREEGCSKCVSCGFSRC